MLEEPVAEALVAIQISAVLAQPVSQGDLLDVVSKLDTTLCIVLTIIFLKIYNNEMRTYVNR